MLDILRQNAKSVLTYVIFGIIIVVFVVSFGPGSKGCSDSRVTQATWAAKVNGEQVPGAEFEQRYAAVFRNYQARAGQGFTREVADQMGLRKMTLDQLVERELMVQEAKRLGIVVTDDDLAKAIRDTQAFHVNGAFDAETYKRVVSANYGSPDRFEARLRDDLVSQKVLAAVRMAIQVPEEELRETFAAEGDKVSLEYVRFPVSGLRAELRVTPEQVKAFQAKGADRIAAYYKENAAKYDKKKRVHARHVLVRADEKAPADVDAAAKKKVEDVLARARKGEDFAALARAVSEDPGSKERGGDLGTFSQGVMAGPFEEAAFAAKSGDLVGPVRTRFGWHAIQVLEALDAEVLPLEKVSDGIARDLLEGDLAREAARKKAEEALAQAKRGRSLAELFPREPTDPKAPRKGPAPVKLGTAVLAVDETGAFGAGAAPNIPRLGPQAALFADALAAKGPGLLDKVYDTPAGPVVVRVKERLRPDAAQFEAKRQEIEPRVRARREAQVEQAWMKSLREKADVKLNEAYVKGTVQSSPVQLD